MALTRLEITSRRPLAGGQTFGNVGAYEQLDGIAHFAVDPENPENTAIADIGLAPRNAEGKVAFSADFRIIKPVDNDHGNGRLLLDVLNRGKELALKNINDSPDAPPDADPHPGNGFMMRHGYSLVWCGWQHDVPSVPGLLRCNVPNAINADGSSVSGRIVVSFQPMSRTEVQYLSDRDHQSYPTNHLESWDSVLTVQDYEDGPETVIPRERWAFARMVDGRRVPDASHITTDGGFEAGKVYRVLYETSHAPVVGLGMLSTRDIVAWLRYGSADDAGTANPLSGAIGRAYAYGRSQSGRFLRQMLYLGLNADESGRMVFEGMLPNVAGGKMGEFNVRFAQPSSLSNRSVNNLPHSWTASLVVRTESWRGWRCVDWLPRSFTPTRHPSTGAATVRWPTLRPTGRRTLSLRRTCGPGCSAERSTGRQICRYRTPTQTRAHGAHSR